MNKWLFVAVAAGFFNGCGQTNDDDSLVRSLTGDDFVGQKYYFGWGAAARNDPAMMHNEVRYDVLHTHDIFTEEVGGSYIGTKEIGSQVNAGLIRGHWAELGDGMSEEDMFVQYSSGHGYRTGLAVGVSYDEIRDNALSYPAKEIVIFTMACQSGGLVDSFNAARSRWENFEEQGRTLLVMASSRTWENSATGPGRDEDEPDGPYGSAGSAFGHALWKALIGYADGYVDGVADGYISLDEIVEFTKWKTQRVGGHIPQLTGVYEGNILMNRVPDRTWLDSLANTTEHMSEAEIAERVAALDATFRLN